MKDPKRKSRTNKTKGAGREGAGNPGPVYGQKEQAPSTIEEEANETKSSEKTGAARQRKQHQTSKANQTNHPKRQKPGGGRGTRGRREGGRGTYHPAPEPRTRVTISRKSGARSAGNEKERGVRH